MSRPSFTGPSCMLGACVCVCGRVVGSACVGRVHVEINVKMRVFIWVSESLSKWVQLCVRVHTDSWTKGAWQVVDSFIFTLGPESDSTEEKAEKKKQKKNLGDIKMNGRRVEKHIMASPRRVTSTADLLLSCLHRCVYIHVCVCACVRLLPFILYPFSLSFPHFLSFSDYTPFSHKVSQSCVCVCMCVYLSKYAWECVCFHPRSVPSRTFFFFSFFFFFFFLFSSNNAVSLSAFEPGFNTFPLVALLCSCHAICFDQQSRGGEEKEEKGQKDGCGMREKRRWWKTEEMVETKGVSRVRRHAWMGKKWRKSTKKCL